MSLLSSYSSANKIDQQALTVRYQVAFTNYAYYSVTRTATRSYAYIGMTEAAATACYTAKLAQYTRTYYSLASSVADGATTPAVLSRTTTGATVTKARGTGDSWTVEISVDETDTRATASAPTDLDDLFSIENARAYDDEFASYQLTISGGGGSVTVSSTIPDFDATACVIEGKTSGSTTWAAVPGSWSGNTFTYSGSYVALRAIYGEYESSSI